METSTIYVAVASYEDAQLLPTLKNLLDTADNPDNITIHVFNQSDKKNPSIPKKYKNNITITKVPTSEARGVGYARVQAASKLADEKYYMQIDPHMRFEKSWDTTLIEITGPETVITQYPGMYEPSDEEDDYKPYKPHKIEMFENAQGWITYKPTTINNNKFDTQLHPTVHGAFIFMYADVYKQVPHDEDIYFYGDEQLYALRIYDKKFNVRHYNPKLTYHYYTREGAPRPQISKEIIKKSEDKNKLELSGKGSISQETINYWKSMFMKTPKPTPKAPLKFKFDIVTSWSRDLYEKENLHIAYFDILLYNDTKLVNTIRVASDDSVFFKREVTFIRKIIAEGQPSRAMIKVTYSNGLSEPPSSIPLIKSSKCSTCGSR